MLARLCMACEEESQEAAQYVVHDRLRTLESIHMCADGTR